MIPKPPQLDDLLYGHKLTVGMGETTILADLDFETYSEAGFLWDESKQKYLPPLNAKVKGLPSIGAAVYSEHETTEVLSCAYDLKDGMGKRLWIPSNPPPTDLFFHILTGGLLEAWNVSFERWIWVNVCMPKYGWPEVPMNQWRDAAAKSVAFALPKGLDPAGEVMNIKHKKHKDGRRLLEKFSMPRNPTKTNPKKRITLNDDPIDREKLYQYNLQDIAAEAELSSLIPDLNDFELEFWQCDQAINFRGVKLDHSAILNAIAIVEQAHKKYNQEIYKLTNGNIEKASELQKIIKWMTSKNIEVSSLDADSIENLMKRDLPIDVRRVLEIRQLIGSAAVKKLYAMNNQITESGRVHDLFIYHSARTGRAAGTGPQPQNLPNSGPMVSCCSACNKHHIGFNVCPWCNHKAEISYIEWNTKAVENAFETINTGILECIEYYWGNAIDIISACLRGMFIPEQSHDFICSDYSAIEAVVLAALAGEEWRLEVFRTHGKIYELSASKISGVPFEEFEKYKKETGTHHPLRKKIGKIAELASGYAGWIGAWKAFGADKYFTDEEIKDAIIAWRNASPAIVEFWGGQQKKYRSEYFGIEGCAIQAVLNPGKEFECRGIAFVMQLDILYCRLLSGRYLTYHRPRLTPSVRRPNTLSLSFEGWNSNPNFGKLGWIRIETYSGKLVENIVQATARDILAHAIINLEKASYPVVLHVHDEIVCEVPENFGSVAEFEKIMSTMPDWAKDWPVKASGGWRSKRYTK
jgi:DNA polymerase bacteriophage-type